jgi:hypothetical protein
MDFERSLVESEASCLVDVVVLGEWMMMIMYGIW